MHLTMITTTHGSFGGARPCSPDPPRPFQLKAKGRGTLEADARGMVYRPTSTAIRLEGELRTSPRGVHAPDVSAARGRKRVGGLSPPSPSYIRPSGGGSAQWTPITAAGENVATGGTPAHPTSQSGPRPRCDRPLRQGRNVETVWPSLSFICLVASPFGPNLPPYH